MNRQDFQDWKIAHFTAEEIEATGANLAHVQIRLLAAMERFREGLGRPFKLIKDGMTTGKHKAPEHLAGLAVDGHVYVNAAMLPLAERAGRRVIRCVALTPAEEEELRGRASAVAKDLLVGLVAKRGGAR